MDLHTLVIVSGIANVLQFFAIFLQYLLNKNYQGFGWWLLWSSSAAIGFIYLFLRERVTDESISASIIFTISILLAGQIFLYIGVMRFFEKQESHRLIISIITALILSTLYTFFVDTLDIARVFALCISVSAVSFSTAHNLIVYHKRSIAISAFFLSAVFIFNGCYFIFQAIMVFMNALHGSVFNPELMQISILIVSFAASTFWSFGLISMLNQSLNVENRESKENLEIILNTSPDAISVIRLSDGRFVNVNDGFLDMTGYSRAEVIGKSTVDLNAWQDPSDRLKVDKILEENGSCQYQEVNFRRKDGSLLVVMFFAKIIKLQGIPHIISVAHDMAERKQSERQLRKLTNVVEQNQVSVVIMNTNGAIEYVNPKFCEVTGYGFEEVCGKGADVFLAVVAPPEVYAELWGTITAGQKWRGRFRSLKKNGEFFWEAAIISPILDEHGVITNYVAVKEDITEQKQAEESLLKLAAVEERQHLARDLHDSVNQSIHGMALFSETLVSILHKNNIERAVQVAERLQESARQALKETRLMLYQLQPSNVERGVDLINDLETRLLTVERRAGVRAQIIQEGSMDYCPQEWHENLFWITIEALNNSMKHAQARNVEIVIRSFPKRLDLEIVDEGIGFDPDKPRSGGLGLKNMRERAHLLGGELTILSTIGRGSKVCFGADLKG